MTQPIQEPTQDRADQALAYRTRQLFRRPAPSGGSGVWIEKSVVTYLDDVNAGVPLFEVTSGDTLLDWWFTVEQAFDGSFFVGLGLYHSDGSLWSGTNDAAPTYYPSLSDGVVDDTSGGLSLVNSIGSYKASLSNAMAYQDTDGRWQTPVAANGTLSLKPVYSTFDPVSTGSMTVYLMRGRALTVSRP